MPPTLKKWEHIGFGLSVSASRVCVCPSVCSKKNQARVLKFHIWIPRQKIAHPNFFLSELSPLPSYAPFKGKECNFVSRIFSKIIEARSFKLGQLVEDDE